METPERPRRGRTTALIAGAAVLGVVAGVCTGYVVQAGRPPAQLPPLSQPVVPQAKGAVEPLTAAQDRRVKTDGDLRKLLLPRPRDARDTGQLSSDHWLSLADSAETSSRPDLAFRWDLENEFRRGATTSWNAGGDYEVEIRLLQYRQVAKPGAYVAINDQKIAADEEPNTDSWPLPDTSDGMVYVHHARTSVGYVAEAAASRGDILMLMWVSDTKPVPKKKIMDLAKRQVARL
ncbi:hypothetical protein AB0L85_13595 [Streptomyces sp. NPDC052051]|uniref:hypothetical protein n=1 Tax=Streptomyces sp. NPDC052051 TaxID=3154649 RepID=UPI00342FAD9E